MEFTVYCLRGPGRRFLCRGRDWRRVSGSDLVQFLHRKSAENCIQSLGTQYGEIEIVERIVRERVPLPESAPHRWDSFPFELNVDA